MLNADVYTEVIDRHVEFAETWPAVFSAPSGLGAVLSRQLSLICAEE
jgi:hypothetical protein